MSSLPQIRIRTMGPGMALPPGGTSRLLPEQTLKGLRLLLSGLFFVCLFDLPFSEALKEISLTAGFLLGTVLVLGKGMAQDFFRVAFRTGWPVFLFAGVSLASGLHSINRMEGLRGFWGDYENLMAFLFFGIGVALWDKREKARAWTTAALLLGTVFGASVGIARMVLEHRPFLGMMNLGDKNSTAQFLSLLMVIVLFFYLDGSGRGQVSRFPGLALSALPALSVLLFLTRSRTFLVAVPLAFLVMIVFMKAWKTLFVLLGILGLGAIAAIVSPVMRWEILSLHRPTADGSFTSRYPTWEGAIRMWKAHPFLGVGPDNFHMSNIHALYHLPDYAAHGHNLFFNLLGEYGSLGVAAFVLWIAVWIRSVGTGIRENRLGNSHVALLSGVLVLLLVGGITHPMWGGSTSLMLMLAMVLSLRPLFPALCAEKPARSSESDEAPGKPQLVPNQPEGVR
ncbi:MAG: O-antigen ligase family protein [Nitrospirae bacterium]|nr:O-antigen ligase family protein [Nitrospirota bacterium]